MNDCRLKYRIMLTNLSDEITKRNVCLDMLKVASADFVNIKTELQKAINPFAIFMLLDTAGHMSQNNLILLIAIIQLLGLTYLKDVIIRSGFEYTENVDTKSVFSLFRRRVISIGKELSDDQLNKISGVYQVPNENCTNQWRLLQYLQDNKTFNNNDELMEFIATVGSVGVIIGWYECNKSTCPYINTFLKI
ncbi:uncharacterized protein LOC117108615 [Anneissia japonica]|uniref:uncharacterized protein LOC117108615 n=1 Tax=Anneissia japonica TaxID=1529436 RepID=UPI001425AB5F|nr:uncharacterized protein LOC117108615 [Anneissia japonica]XP_033106589.1 uncharacterized protein LOC117108615 [Anneissia japonica]